ncbi:MAG: beta strand repeat-containing protein [Nitrososphaerales archaeon]
MTTIRFTENKLVVSIVAFLLISSSFVFLPAFAASVTPRASIAGPSVPAASVAGAVATIDYPILNGLSTSVTRTFTISNPSGNPSIASLTISLPTGASSTTPSGTCSAGVPNSPCSVQVFGSGQYSVVYHPPAADNGVLIPGGSSVNFTVTFTTETALTTLGKADTYALLVSATDSTGQTTQLNSVNVYETQAVTIAIGAPSVTPLTVGTVSTIAVAANNASGDAISSLPLVAFVSSGTSTTTTISPTSFTSASSTTISVNDTTAEKVKVTVQGIGVMTGSSGNTAPVNAQTSSAIKFTSGLASTIAVSILGSTSPTLVNETTFAPINGNSIIISTADKYGNPVNTGSAVSVTVTTVSQGGSANAGFSPKTTFGASYPYMPSNLVTSDIVTIPSGFSSISLFAGTASNDNYFFSVDYGAKSYILATASGVTSGISSWVVTWGFSNSGQSITSVTPSAVTTTVAAGGSQTIEATLNIAQANLPVNFTMTNAAKQGYTGLLTGGVNTTVVNTSINSTSLAAYATVSLTVDTTAGAKTAVNAFGNLNPTATVKTATVASGNVKTIAGSLSQLVISASFNAGTTGTSTTYTVPSQAVYLSAMATDPYGNVITATADTQVTFGATGGSLSTPTALIANGQTSTNATGHITVVALTPGSASSIAVSASATFSGTPVTGSLSITVVSANPTMTLNAPTTWTSGQSSTLSGIANVSLGLSGVTLNGASVTFSVNGGKATNAGVSTTVNTAKTGLSYSITTLLTSSANFITVTVTDSGGNTVSMSVQVPALQSNQRFGFSAAPASTTILGTPGVNATIKNQYSGNLTAYVYFKVINSQNQTVQIYEEISTLTPLSTQSFAVGLVGLAHGTYTVQVFVLDSSQAPASPSDTVTVTV